MPQTEAPPRRANLFRGLAYAVLFAAFGFTIPFAGDMAIFAVQSRRSTLDGYHEVEQRYSLQQSTDYLILPGLGCATMFALAAILNFSPATRLGMIRSLMFVGLAILAGGIVAGTISTAFDLRQRTYMDDPWSDWRGPTLFLIWFSIPVVYTIEHTFRRIRREQMAEPEA